MRVAYVMPLPELGGGNKAIFQHARLLGKLGHEVTVLAQGQLPTWSRYRGRYIDYSSEPPRVGSQDLVIATYWPTIATAHHLGVGKVAHFCQGYEGSLEHLATQREEIEAAYSRPMPTIAVSPSLAELVRQRFGRPARVVPPVADPLFRPRSRFRLPGLGSDYGVLGRPGPRARPRIAVPGAFEAPVKGVVLALDTVLELRRRGRPATVLRFSPLQRTEEERALLEADRYLCGVDPKEIAKALRRCDLLLFCSRAEEGFGLPALEAMASGVPVVATSIPSVEFMAGDAVTIAEPAAMALATAAERLLSDRLLWLEMAQRGVDASRRFGEEEVASRLASAVEWAASVAPDTLAGTSACEGPSDPAD